MGLPRLILIVGSVVFGSQIALGEFSTQTSYKILQADRTSHSLSLYLNALQTHEDHDFFVLRKIAENCLRQGLFSSDPQIRKGVIIGSGLANSLETLDILSLAMEDPDPIQQLLVLSSLSSYSGKTSNEILLKALSSPYPMIRLEAAYRLAGFKNIKVVDHLHSFIHKLPEEVRALSAAIFLRLETEESDSYIRELLTSPNSVIRNYTALLIGEYKQKRFISTLRKFLTSASTLDQEGALYSLGKLKDGLSYPHIKRLSKKDSPDLSLAAAQAFIDLGNEEEALPILKQQVLEERPRALYTCRSLSKEEGISLLLPVFLSSKHGETQLNAGLSLLHLGCTHPALLEYFISWLEISHTHQTIMLTYSPGRATSSWKFTAIMLPDNPSERSRVLSFIHNTEEYVLNLLLQLPNDAFLPYVNRMIRSQKTNLAAKTIAALSQKPQKYSLDILSQAAQLPGEPIIRAYADLALYHLTKEPQYKKLLHKHAIHLVHQTFLFIDTESNTPQPQSTYLRYQVAPEAKAQLMLDILETLVSTKTHEDIRFLIQLMIQTNPKNLPVLSGLLMKMIE